MPPVLDVAIGVVFVFLLFSLVVSALNEVILSALDTRAKFLREGLVELFRDTARQEATITADKFLRHGMITVLSRGQFGTRRSPAGRITRVLRWVWSWFRPRREDVETTGVPSYIPGKSFVLALLSLITEGNDPNGITDLRASIAGIGNKELRQTLLALYDDAKGDLELFKANIENWFNESMDRVSGWYKRYAQQWLVFLGFAIAAFCNVDSVRIIRALSIDPELRESIVRQAETYAGITPTPAPAPGAVTAPPAGAQAPAAGPALDPAAVQAKIDTFKSSLASLGGTGIPMGWSDGPSQHLVATLPTLRNAFNPFFWWHHFSGDKALAAIGAWGGALVGWSISALAASLGAPFWFDTLNRFVDIRGVGRAPEEKDPTAPKRRASETESYMKTGDSRRSGNQPLPRASRDSQRPRTDTNTNPST